ncbi:hypothetical protein NF865_10345 [Thermococcus aggregans]|uniref:Uncharacterized protein n=1 Tax=Thermococcus aggregans TaxID=110163 RepID=A0A9E7SNV3_THEAG|nr:hypothetical protein [Thermococcus aggregans]USS40660.1 hypothetical protein NF865_10345 [Thermococcus aggregans]
MGSKRTALPFVLAIIFIVGSVLVPPKSYSGPGDVHVPSNEKFERILRSFNVTEPEECTPEALMIVECKVNGGEELNGTLAFFEDYPHGPIALYEGEGGSFSVIVEDRDAFGDSLPQMCSMVESKNTSVHGEEQANILKTLSAYKELEGVLKDPAEKGFIHNKTLELERLLADEHNEKPCNFTLATVRVEYPKPGSNVPFMVLFWSSLGVLGCVGVVSEKKKDRKLVFGVLVVLSILFVGTYLHDSWVQRNSAEGISMIEKLNGSVTLQDSANFGILYVTVDSPKKAKALVDVLMEFNVSVRVQRDDSLLKLEGTLPLEKLDAFREASTKVGSFYFHNQSRFYVEFLERYRRENDIIRTHLTELSPESRETLEEVLEENEDSIENLNEAMNKRARLIIFISTSSPSTPEAYHDLSAKLAFIGVFFALGGLVKCLVDDERNR